MDHEAFSALLRRRSMTRSFADQVIDPALLSKLLEGAMSAPSAGNSRGVQAVVLTGEARSRYWDAATDEDWRERSRRFAGMSRAGAVVLVLCNPEVYTARYAEEDKASSGLGDEAAWPVPYWFGDAAFATMALLLGAEAAGLGAAFLGTFRHEDAVLEAIGRHRPGRLFGTVLLGHPDGQDLPSASLTRAVPSKAERVTWLDS